MRILVVEDEEKVARLVQSGLEQNGYEVDVAYDGYLAENLVVTREYDVVLLDIIIPLVNGIDLCARIKQAHPGTPVLMLTALGTTADKVKGFEAGADDYLVKPFDFEELLMRVKALTKRSGFVSRTSREAFLQVADLKLDVYKKEAYRGGKSIRLTAKEFDLLEFFMKNSGRVISKAELAEHVWELTFDTGTNVVEVYINLLRRKIDRDFEHKLIETRIGLGYIMNGR